MGGADAGTRARVLVTGAGGFIGAHLCPALAQAGFEVVRAPAHDDEAARAAAPLDGVEAVVHLAALVHRPRGAAGEADYRRANVDATARLAERAVAAGVRRFVFMSTVKVHGERSPLGGDGRARPFTEADAPAPADAYARSKWAAEQRLHAIAAGTPLAVTVLRPPLVYGPGVRANFLALLRAVDRGLPLPFGALRNRRSLLYVGNLVDAVRHCLQHAGAADRTFLVADGEDLSTPALVRALAKALGRPARLVPVPEAWLRAAGTLIGRRAALDRLCGSLHVCADAIGARLHWQAPFSVAEGLAATAAWYRGAGLRGP